MGRMRKPLRMVGLFIALALIFTACDLLGDEEVLDNDPNGDDDVVIDDGVTVVTDAELWEFSQEFVTAMNVFAGQDLDVEFGPDDVDYAAILDFFEFPLYWIDNWGYGEYIDQEAFEQRVYSRVYWELQENATFNLHAYSVEEGFAAMSVNEFPDGKAFQLTLFVSAIFPAEGEGSSWIVPHEWQFLIAAKNGEFSIWGIENFESSGGE